MNTNKSIDSRDSRFRGNLICNEIFYSIQGESSQMGRPCVFIRFTYCNLRCTYCDTEYAFYEGKDMRIDEIIAEVEKYKCNLVEITGGEPLMQENVLELMRLLCEKDYMVMLKTGGSLPINNVDKRVKIIMDLKTPSSGMEKKNLYSNVDFIKRFDEIKFVIGTKEDYNWSKQIIEKYKLLDKAAILMSPVFNEIQNIDLASWILEDKINVRFQVQLHKYIWHPETRGV